MIPEAAVEAAAAALWRRGRVDLWEDARDYLAAEFRDDARLVLEAAAPHLRAWATDLHAYAAAGLTACGLETGGPISRRDGYTGPAVRTTTNDSRVTCAGCKP